MRYKYVGETEVNVPDLAGRVTVREHPGLPIQPGEVFETDLEINNATFELVLDNPPAAPSAPEPEAPAEIPAEEVQ